MKPARLEIGFSKIATQKLNKSDCNTDSLTIFGLEFSMNLNELIGQKCPKCKSGHLQAGPFETENRAFVYCDGPCNYIVEGKIDWKAIFPPVEKVTGEQNGG